MKKSDIYLVSACLLGENCKYNGGNNYHKGVVKHLKDKRVVPICPEILGYLGVPREPCEILGSKVVTNTGRDITADLVGGVFASMNVAQLGRCGVAILKSMSPSCGIGRIYDGTFSGRLIEGDGLLVRMLRRTNIELYSERDFD